MKTFDTDLALPLIAATRAEAQMKRCGDLTALCVLTLARDTGLSPRQVTTWVSNHRNRQTR
jgi:hypothetical protein